MNLSTIAAAFCDRGVLAPEAILRPVTCFPIDLHRYCLFTLMSPEDTSHDAQPRKPLNDDRGTLEDLMQMMAREDIIAFLRTFSFGNAYRQDSMNPLYDFIDLRGGPEHEFIDPELEKLRQGLLEATHTFLSVLRKNTFRQREMGGTHIFFRIPDEWEMTQGPKYHRAIKDMNTAAEEVCKRYDDLVRTARANWSRSTVSPQLGSAPRSPGTATTEEGPLFDVFVSHATEDKAYVEPLVKALKDAEIRVWFDKITLEWGDALRPGIDRGLTNCRYGIVVFSKAFLRKKKWTEYELDSLFAMEKVGRKVILPIWHGITRDDLIQYSPAFADRLAKILSTDSHGEIVGSLLAMLGRSKAQNNDMADSAVSVAKRAKTTEYAPGTTGGNAQAADAYSEDLEQQARQVVGYGMTLNGQHLLRQLLIHGTFRSNQQFMPEISLISQNE